MGLYNDSVYPQRESWSYTYRAEDLLEAAKSLFKMHSEQEIVARNKMADLLKDVSVKESDSRFNELKRDIATHGKLKEQCQVFVHEFTRTPNKEIELGLGDVTFFGLADKVLI